MCDRLHWRRHRRPAYEAGGATEGGEAVGGSSCGREFGSGGGSTQMISISNGCPYADSEVLIKRLGKDLLPTA
jgi:hypothetical protein